MQQPQRLVRVPRQLLEPEIRNLSPEIFARHVFHLMRFVEHDGRILRQNAAEIVLLQRQIGKEQMMVDNDQVGFFRSLVHPRHKTRIERRALFPRAGVPPRVELSPQFRIVRQKRQLRSVACLG